MLLLLLLTRNYRIWASNSQRFNLKILLDTHALIWWLRDDVRLTKLAAGILQDPENRILISAGVGWELAIKVGLGKIEPSSLIEQLNEAVAKEKFEALPISLTHGVHAGLLPPHHRDPFDRLLSAQALQLHVPILSVDRVFDLYGVQRMW
jgi:PIN domain nuclease of toxin-antitoxin system